MFWLTKVGKLRNLRFWPITSSISVQSTPKYKKQTENRPGTTLDASAPPVAKPGHSCLTNLFMARASQNPVHARKFK